jgi:membrane protein implicated in regulation of membrane protease activity
VRKLWCSLGVALLVGTLTLITSILSDIRLSASIYRFAVSFIVFGLVSYILAMAVEKFVKPKLMGLNSKGQRIDIISKQEPVSESDAEDNSFTPFTPDNLERIPTPKD